MRFNSAWATENEISAVTKPPFVSGGDTSIWMSTLRGEVRKCNAAVSPGDSSIHTDGKAGTGVGVGRGVGDGVGLGRGVGVGCQPPLSESSLPPPVGPRCKVTGCGPPVILNPAGLATLTFTLAPLAHVPVMVTVRDVPVPDMPVTVAPGIVMWLAARPVGFALKFSVSWVVVVALLAPFAVTPVKAIGVGVVPVAGNITVTVTVLPVATPGCETDVAPATVSVFGGSPLKLNPVFAVNVNSAVYTRLGPKFVPAAVPPLCDHVIVPGVVFVMVAVAAATDAPLAGTVAVIAPLVMGVAGALTTTCTVLEVT